MCACLMWNKFLGDRCVEDIFQPGRAIFIKRCYWCGICKNFLPHLDFWSAFYNCKSMKCSDRIERPNCMSQIHCQMSDLVMINKNIYGYSQNGNNDFLILSKQLFRNIYQFLYWENITGYVWNKSRVIHYIILPYSGITQ